MPLPNLLAKYSSEPSQSGSSGMPDLLSKYGASSPATPTAPLAKPTLPQLQQREAAAKANADSANSFTGLLKNTITGAPAAAGKIATGLANADVGQAFGNNSLNATRAGVMANTVFGLPKAAKETLFPNRGFTDEQLAKAKPGLPDLLQGIPKVAAEVASSGGDLLNKIPGYSDVARNFANNTPLGRTLANKGAAVQDYAIPKTAEQAAAMRGADFVQFVPVGSIKNIGTAAKALEGASDAEKGAKIVTDAAAVQEIRNGIQEGKNLLRKGTNTLGEPLTTDQRISIRRAVQNGEAKIGEGQKIKDYTVEDVTPAGYGPDAAEKLPVKRLTNKGGVQIDEGNTYTPFEGGKSARKSANAFDAYFQANNPKQVSQLDRLIADGKIRVTRRGEYDVFQVKKGGEWKNTRDQYSAIAQVTKEPLLKPKVEAPHIEELKQKVEDAKTASQVAHETLGDMPGKQLVKYRSSATGELPEVNSKAGSGKFNLAGDTIVQNKIGQDLSKGGDLETAQQHLDEYTKAQTRAKEFKQNHLDLKSQLSEARTLEKNKPAQPLLPKPEVPVSHAKPALDSMSEGEARSLEQVANQHHAESGLGKDTGSSMEEVIKKAQTPAKKKVNMLDYIRTPDRVLKKIGLEKEAQMLHEHYDEYLKELPKNIDKITAWSKEVGKDSNERIFKYLDGGAIDLRPNEVKVAHEIRNWLMNWADRLNLPKNQRISHYITHLFDDQLIQKEFDEDLAKIITDKIPGSVYDPFLEKRLGIQGYKRDTWAALDAYAKRATRKVNMDPILKQLEEKSGTLEESQWKYIKRYADRINLRPTEIDNLIDNGIKGMVGYRFGARPVARITQGARQIAYRAMIGLNPGSALRNLSQGANTYAKLGEKYTAIGYSKLFTKAAREELTREGILNNGFIQDRALSSTKKVLEKVDKGLFVFFDGAEKINRGAAYLGGKAKALAAGKTEAEAIQLAKKLVRDTQFTFGSVDTPVGMSSDIVKTLSQFQTYTTKQIEFLTEMARNKEFAGLLRYGGAGMVFVYTVGQAFGMKPQELLPIYRLGVPPSLKVPVEIGKAALRVPDQYGNVPTLQKSAANIGDALLTGVVPGGTQIKKTVQGYQALQSGASVTSSGKVNYRVGGTLAKDAQALAFGKYASKEAQDFYNGVKGPEETKAQDIYDKAQKLKAEGKDQEANALWGTLSPSQKKIYKYIKAAAKTKATQQTETKLMPLYWRLQQMKKDGKADEANALYGALTKEEKHAYGLIKNKFK